MLSLLQIKNFALIDHLELTLNGGLNVLTGETGAGKSIILDAIDIVLGGKVNPRFVRQGTQQASIEATFLASSSLQTWLATQEIEVLEDGTLICSRDLTLTGSSLRSRSRVNGVLVNRQLLAQLREQLVEITAQGQTVQLLDSSLQRQLLDLYGGKTILAQRAQVESLYHIWQQAKKNLQERRQSEQQRLQRLDLLEYQLKELQEARLEDPLELDNLEMERDRLSHVVDLQDSSYQVYQLLYQNDHDAPAVADLLGKAEHILTNIIEYDREIEPILEMVRSAYNQVVEAGMTINAYGDRLEVDPQRLGEVEERILELKRICRKYGPSLREAWSYYQKSLAELREIKEGGQSIEALEKLVTTTYQDWEKAALELSDLRQKAAHKLEKQLVKELKPLAMEKVIFVCQITPVEPNSTGLDQVVFYFSPNPGEKIQPLASTASGGEMSRFLLALKACFSQIEAEKKTLIFDEIDAGVSGKVAQAIAEKLRQLSQQHQVLCVTHQPLVAALADAHFRVDKQMIAENTVEEGGEIRTVVRITILDNHQTRRQELAQLTGGHSAEEAIAFADSLLKLAQNTREK
jgi:DNA repair protein RecN (Recombination protein N)